MKSQKKIVTECDKSDTDKSDTKMIKKRTHKHLIFEAPLHKKPLRGKKYIIIINNNIIVDIIHLLIKIATHRLILIFDLWPGLVFVM